MKRSIRNAMANARIVRNAYDALLIERAKHGSRDAFGKLYRFHLDAIYRYVYFRVGQDRQLAEDVTHDIFFKAWAKRDQFRFKTGTVKAWLYKIASSTVTDYYRTHKNHMKMHDEIKGDTDIEAAAIRNEEVRDVLRAVDTLTSDQKSVVIMSLVEGLSNDEIACTLEITNEAVRALKHRALKQLRKKLKH